MIDAIVLAAGLGTRIGRIKPLIEIGGEPSLGIILRRLRAASVSRPIVVLGKHAGRIRERVDLSDARVVVNPEPKRGMAMSLRLGLEAVSEHAAGVMILHADMPFVEEETIRSVLDAARTGVRIAAASHAGQRGFPVYLARACFPELLETLAGDVGARGYIARHIGELTLVEAEGEGCLRDIDTPEDLPEDLSGIKETLHALHADR